MTTEMLDQKATAHLVTFWWLLRYGNWFVVTHRKRWFPPLIWRLWDGSWRFNFGPITICANRPRGRMP